MEADTVNGIIASIGAIFHHIPIDYAVCGLAAMTHYGFDKRRPRWLSIICPEKSRAVIGCWLMARGLSKIQKKKDTYGINIGDGTMREVRIRYLVGDFHYLARRSDKNDGGGGGNGREGRRGRVEAPILSLASLADMLALDYVQHLQHISAGAQRNIAIGMCWTLQRILSLRSPDHDLTRQRAQHMLLEEFWFPFTLCFPEAMPLFEAIGLDRWMREKRLDPTAAMQQPASVRTSSPIFRSNNNVDRRAVLSEKYNSWDTIAPDPNGAAPEGESGADTVWYSNVNSSDDRLEEAAADDEREAASAIVRPSNVPRSQAKDVASKGAGALSRVSSLHLIQRTAHVYLAPEQVSLTRARHAHDQFNCFCVYRFFVWVIYGLKCPTC
jgi:hypothetical protein